MTVKQLIRELQKMDKNAKVEIANRSLTEDMRGDLIWVGGGTRLANSVTEKTSEYTDKKIVVIN